MLRDQDEFDEPAYDCPKCHRTLGSFARLDDHMAEHEGPRQCQNCGKYLSVNEYHRC